MEKRRLGTSELMVSPLAFGGNVFGWTLDEKASFDILDAALDAGLNFIDTADVYARWSGKGGESETILGKWMRARGNRSDIVLATKVGMEMGSKEKGLSRAWILKAVDNSLRRLQTDYIDLYQAHIDDPSVPPEETAEAFAGLVQSGKVRVLGASNFSAERLAAALAVSSRNGMPRYQSLQPHYNLYERSSFEGDLEALCVREQIGAIPYFPLAAGFLSGKYRTEADMAKSKRGGAMGKYMNTRGFRILDALDEVAGQTGTSPACVALAWLLQRPGVAAPIASATSREQLAALTQAATLTLTPTAVGLLDHASRGQGDK